MVGRAGSPSAPPCLSSPHSLHPCLDLLGDTCRIAWTQLHAHPEASRTPLQHCGMKREKSVERSVQRKVEKREKILHERQRLSPCLRLDCVDELVALSSYRLYLPCACQCVCLLL